MLAELDLLSESIGRRVRSGQSVMAVGHEHHGESPDSAAANTLHASETERGCWRVEGNALKRDNDNAEIHRLTRDLRGCVEPILGVVFQAPEARRGALGLNPLVWYMAGRAAALGAIRPAAAAAVFAPFNPVVVERALRGVWGRVSVEDVLDARLASACRVLEELLGEERSTLTRAIELLRPIATAGAGYAAPLYAGLKSLEWPESQIGVLWRCCDLIREHRGDVHNAAWRAAGLDAVEVNVLSELWQGAEVGSVAVKQMGWSHDAARQALSRLQAAGLADDGMITAAGRDLRDDIELATSLQQREYAEALRLSSEELFGLLTPWAQRCRESAVAYWQSDDPT